LTGARVRTSIRRVKPWFLLFAASIVAVAACGARSGLRVDELREDAGPEPVDAGRDAIDDAADVLDAPEEPDVVDPFPDAANDCTDAGITYIYLISTENALLRFYPPDLSITTIGTIDCPTTTPANPFSMAVDRKGVAHVLFSNGELFRVSTLTASCKPTGFVSQQDGFPLTFGMGFSANKNDPGETLFVAGAGNAAGSNGLVGSIDLATFKLSTIGPVSSPIGNPELTGTGDSRLFGFGPGVPDSHVAEIDKTTAIITSDVILNLNQSAISAWAFAFWGGDFYFFTSESQGTSFIHRYTPGGITTPPVLAVVDLTIVGAGVSTCAPSE
jgi:hypothetical protein